jgi:hypothetical protein
MVRAGASGQRDGGGQGGKLRASAHCQLLDCQMSKYPYRIISLRWKWLIMAILLPYNTAAITYTLKSFIVVAPEGK